MHLSDLHIATNAEWNNMKECLLRELQNKMKSVPEGKKLLVITGDFHVFGQKDFSEAEKFISELIQKTGLQKKKDVFVVPGNHDICYSDDKEEKARQVSIIKSVILDNDEWLLIRPSGTEPLLRIYAESATKKDTQALLDLGAKLAGVSDK